MKEAETNPGKSYSVHSSAGCTVSDDSGWSKTLEAPEDYFTAHSGKVYIDDDTATVRELFKLAPYQKLRLLGVVGGNKLPYRYTRLAYLESTGTQYIKTEKEFLPGDGFAIEYLQASTGYRLEEAVGTRASERYVFPPRFGSSESVQEAYFYTAYYTYLKPWGRVVARINYKNDGIITLYGESGTSDRRTLPKVQEINLPALWVFGTAVSKFIGRVWWVEQTRASQIICNLIPALDNTGTPCLFDLVTEKPFRNSGAGAFICGIDTQPQLDNLLRKLPDRTGLEVGTLQVRLADELQTPENEAKLDAMLAKNWEITQAA